MEVPQQSPRHRAITRIARQPYKIQQILAQVRAEIGVRPETGPGDIERLAGAADRQQLR